jgi:uncharacterized protein
MVPGRIASTQVADFAARNVSMVGSFRAREFGRLAPSVADDSGYSDQIEVTCRFGHGLEGHPEVELWIAGQVGLVCQRCLAPVGWDLDTRVRLTIVEAEREVGELSDPFDSISMHDGVLDLTAAIEDEILSAMPLAPVHSAGAPCARSPEEGKQTVGERAAVSRPFAVLRDLINSPDSENADRPNDRRGEK